MASGSPCVNSRWDQIKPKAVVLQGVVGNEPHAVSSPDMTASCSSDPGFVHPPPEGPEPPQGGVEMAAAMAAKINAMLMAKGKLKTLQPLPSKASAAAPPPVCAGEVVVAEVDINDVPVNCRTLLTEGKTHEEIHQFSGAVISTKGLYMTDNSTGVARRLYLHVQGRSHNDVNKAVARIKAIISENVLRSSDGQQPPGMPTVPVYHQPPLPPASRPPNLPIIPGHKPPPPHSGSFVHTKIFVGLDQSHPSFNVNERVEGRSGSYLQHIQSETGARVFLRGKGSGYIEQASRRESFEPLHLYVSHPNAAGLDAAKKLCENLLETVRAEHARVTSTCPAAVSAPVYSTHGSWYSYPSCYPLYNASTGFWNNSSSDASQLSNSLVQYPVWSLEHTAFTSQDEDTVCERTDCDSNSRDSLKPSEEMKKTQNEASADVLLEVVTDRSSESILMPPPLAVPVTSSRKRQRVETFSKHLRHTITADGQQMKPMKLEEDSSSSSGLVPYAGDSSDEEEERMRCGDRTAL